MTKLSVAGRSQLPLLDERDRIVAACNTGPLVSAFQSDSVHMLWPVNWAYG